MIIYFCVYFAIVLLKILIVSSYRPFTLYGVCRIFGVCIINEWYLKWIMQSCYRHHKSIMKMISIYLPFKPSFLKPSLQIRVDERWRDRLQNDQNQRVFCCRTTGRHSPKSKVRFLSYLLSKLIKGSKKELHSIPYLHTDYKAGRHSPKSKVRLLKIYKKKCCTLLRKRCPKGTIVDPQACFLMKSKT